MGHLACTIDWEKVVRVFSALLTPLIAIIAVYIALQQYKVNKGQFKLALRDRRKDVFEATIELIVAVLKTAKVEHADLTKFLVGTSERDFLFGSDINAYLNNVYDKAVELYALTDAKGDEQIAKWKAAVLWFGGQAEEARKKFAKYIAISEP
jgi:hypothetical protein